MKTFFGGNLINWTKRIVLALFLYMAVFLLTACAQQAKAPKIAAVRFTSSTADGQVFDDSMFQKARLTLVDIFSTDCGPCGQEVAVLNTLPDVFDKGDVQVLGIAANREALDNPRLVSQFLQTYPAQYPVVLANEEMMGTFLAGVKKVPAHLLVDAQGNPVADMKVGKQSAEELQRWLRQHLPQ